MTYQPIENYGVIGNMRTAALISTRGSIDWFCCPKFDSPSVFARILDDRDGGYFEVVPLCDRVTEKQCYWPDTNILVTRFLSEYGIVELIDFMPAAGPEAARHQIIRRIHCVRGEVPLRLACHPAFNYGRDTHETELTGQGAIFTHPSLSLALATHLPLRRTGSGVEAQFRLRENESCTLALRVLDETNSCGMALALQEN